MRLTSIRGHHVWTAPLGSQSVVVDAGAHRGEFSAILKREYGCRCVLIEANPQLAEALNGLRIGIVMNAALAAEDGRTTLYLQDNLESSSIIMADGSTPKTTMQIEAISLQTVLARAELSHIDLLKLEIEGAEFGLIEQTPDETWSKVAQITIEFHDFAPRFAKRRLFKKAQVRLHRLGFSSAVMSFRTHGDVLFLNRRRLPLPGWARFNLHYLARFKSRMLQNRIDSRS